MKDIRIAAVVCQSLVGAAEDNFYQMTKWVGAAKNSGVELICFPEMNITGYSIHKSILGHSEALTGSVVEKLARLARLENIMILAGIAEKYENKKKVFASHLVIRSDGSWKNYRKLHIAPPEKDVFAAGNEIPVFSSRKIKFGIQLCYDTHFPELSTCMAMKGVDIIFMPHASPRGTPESKFRSWMRHLPARAFDNGVFVIACNQTGENGEDLKFPGLALVIGPDGKVVHKDISGKEGLLIADLKSKDLDAVRDHRMRYFLPNRRPELYGVK